jgi:hypothetical protein
MKKFGEFMRTTTFTVKEGREIAVDRFDTMQQTDVTDARFDYKYLDNLDISTGTKVSVRNVDSIEVGVVATSKVYEDVVDVTFSVPVEAKTDFYPANFNADENGMNNAVVKIRPLFDMAKTLKVLVNNTNATIMIPAVFTIRVINNLFVSVVFIILNFIWCVQFIYQRMCGLQNILNLYDLSFSLSDGNL